MKLKLKAPRWAMFLLLVSFLLDACHSGKEVTKSSAYTKGETEKPLRNNASGKSKPKNSPGSSETVRKENAIINTYAAKLGVSKKDINNYQLYKFIDAWYGTPYKYAGRTKAGVDCSDFASLLYKSVYNVTLSGAVTQLYKQCKPIKPSQLREGDLVFFKINKKSFSHVGVYLQNHKFVHASVHSGVIIDDLGENYYKKYFRAAGRIMN